MIHHLQCNGGNVLIHHLQCNGGDVLIHHLQCNGGDVLIHHLQCNGGDVLIHHLQCNGGGGEGEGGVDTPATVYFGDDLIHHSMPCPARQLSVHSVMGKRFAISLTV